MDELLELRRGNPEVKIISFSRNFGQIPAIIAGFRHATGDAVINIAADMQEPAEAVVAMIREWEKGSVVVLGQRVSREDSLSANLLGNLYWRILKKANPALPVGSDFFLLARQAVDIFNRIEESDRFFPVDVLWLGFRPKIVPYRRLRRQFGRSQWRIATKVKAGLDGILHSTYLPIRLISMTGIGIACLGFIAAFAVFIHRLTSETAYPGWASIIFLLLFLNGLTMLMLGIIGEYVWRIYNQAKGRPAYIISEKHG